jgi:hypothetical protein
MSAADELDESDALADALAFTVDFAVADDDGLFVGLDEDLAAAVDTWPGASGAFVQLGLAAGWTLFLADPLELGLALEDAGGVLGAEPPGLALGATLWLGLALGLLDALELALVVLPLLVLPLEDVAGAVVVAVVAPGDLLLVAVTDACADGDAQALREGCSTTPGLLAGTPPAGEDVGEIVLPWPSAVGGVLDLVMLKAEPMALPTLINPWRVTGTTDRTTPSANTAAPRAKAGRSMASRQSLGRFGSRRRGSDCAPPRPAGLLRRRISLTATPETPSQTPRIQLGWLACAGRDRILSRIRSRPSEPGSTWSAAAWSSRRKKSAKSFPCPPSKPRPDLTMTPAPAPRATRPCHARCDS